MNTDDLSSFSLALGPKSEAKLNLPMQAYPPNRFETHPPKKMKSSTTQKTGLGGGLGSDSTLIKSIKN